MIPWVNVVSEFKHSAPAGFESAGAHAAVTKRGLSSTLVMGWCGWTMVKRSITWLLLACCASTCAADEASFVPGRPGNTESPVTVASGHWQVESELVSYAHDRSQGVSTNSWQAAATSFRYGLAPSTDTELILRPYVRSDSPGSDREGLGDLTLRARHMLLSGDDGPSLALIAYLTMPTSHDDLGAHTTEGGLIVTSAMALSTQWSATLTAGAAAVSADRGGHAADVYGGMNLSYALSERCGTYAEIFADKTDGAPTVVVLQTGLTFMLTPVTQLDAGVEPGLNRAADAWRVFVGWAHRY